MSNYISGIYQIKCAVNQKIYIGSSVDVEKRWKYHIQDLNRNTHANSHLQNAWNKYGEANFFFSILESVFDPFNLVAREQFWLDALESYNDKFGFNICKTAESQLGSKWTEIQKQQHSTRMKLKGIESVNKANERNKELRQSGEFYKRYKLNKQLVSEMVDDYNSGMTIETISKKFNVGKTTVKNIMAGKTWAQFTSGLLIYPRRILLANTDVDFIRDQLDKNIKPKKIAELLKVPVQRIYQIKYGKTWKKTKNHLSS